MNKIITNCDKKDEATRKLRWILKGYLGFGGDQKS